MTKDSSYTASSSFCPPQDTQPPIKLLLPTPGTPALCLPYFLVALPICQDWVFLPAVLHGGSRLNQRSKVWFHHHWPPAGQPGNHFCKVFCRHHFSPSSFFKACCYHFYATRNSVSIKVKGGVRLTYFPELKKKRTKGTALLRSRTPQEQRGPLPAPAGFSSARPRGDRADAAGAAVY